MKRGRNSDDDTHDVQKDNNDRTHQTNEPVHEIVNADDTKRGEGDCDNETHGIDGEDNGMGEAHKLDDADEVERACDYCDCGFDNDGSDNEDDSVSDSGINCQKLQRALGKLMCSSGLQPRSIEHESFIKYVNSICPMFETDLDTVKVDCLQIYEEEKTRVKHILKNMNGQISISADVLMYQSRDGNIYDFICLSAHFIDDNWKLRKWVLNFRRFEWLHRVIIESLKDWEIERKISTLTSLSIDDDEEDEIVERVKTQVQEKKKLSLNGLLFRVNCCAAMFKSMVEDAFNEISKIIDKVSLLSWSKSAPAWYLTTTKLKNALELERMGEFSPENVSEYYDVPSQDEWKKVECVCKLTDSAYTTAKVLFETKSPTANIYLYNLQMLRSILMQESIGSCEFTSNVAKKMLQRLEKYCKNAFMVLAIAVVMDPCYKMKYIEYIFSKFERTDGISQVALVLDTIRSLYNDYVNHTVERQDSESDSTSSHSKEDFPRSLEKELCNSNWVEDYSKFVQTTDQPPKSDLDLYLEEAVLPCSEDFNVLKWWRAEGPKYPILSKMARDFLAIPMSVATSYEAFYTEPREIYSSDISSGLDVLNAKMCTRSWLQKQ